MLALDVYDGAFSELDPIYEFNLIVEGMNTITGEQVTKTIPIEIEIGNAANMENCSNDSLYP